MFFTRTGGAIFVILLIGGLAYAGIALTAYLGPASAHGTHVMSAHGTIIQVGPNRDFVFETTPKEHMSFVCETGCRASLRHLVRHLKEKAPTDVYYVPGPNHTLLAVDVD